MAKTIDDIQKLSQTNIDGALKVWGEWTKGWQAIAAEMSDYSKRSFEEGTETFEKLMSAKSVEQAIEIQSGYAKRAYDDYVRQMTRLGSMYVDLAKDAAKPVERLMQGVTSGLLYAFEIDWSPDWVKPGDVHHWEESGRFFARCGVCLADSPPSPDKEAAVAWAHHHENSH